MDGLWKEGWMEADEVAGCKAVVSRHSAGRYAWTVKCKSVF